MRWKLELEIIIAIFGTIIDYEQSMSAKGFNPGKNYIHLPSSSRKQNCQEQKLLVEKPEAAFEELEKSLKMSPPGKGVQCGTKFGQSKNSLNLYQKNNTHSTFENFHPGPIGTWTDSFNNQILPSASLTSSNTSNFQTPFENDSYRGHRSQYNWKENNLLHKIPANATVVEHREENSAVQFPMND